MNVDDVGANAIDRNVWEPREMRAALAARDLTAVYRRLQRVGVSQRRIAALTGQAPSEVYEILNGRKVMAYDVLVRIADGLGVPRGYMGLSYDESTQVALEVLAGNSATHPDERLEVRQLLAHAAEVTMGADVGDVASWWQPVEQEPTPLPRRVGAGDVERVEAITAVMRALDYRHGGGACRDAVVAQVRWAQRLLAADYGDAVAGRLHRALADLHNLAGWISFDVGLYRAARRHFARALQQAKYGDDASLVANVLYRMGRLHLHRGWYRDALRFFQLGQIAAQDSGCELTVAMLCANEAWAHALMQDAVQAGKSIGRAYDEFARADLASAAAWVRFFGPTDLQACTGMVYLACQDDRQAQLDPAIEILSRAVAERGSDMTRSQAFELTALATAYLRAGDVDCAIPAGLHATDLAEQLRSARVIDRLEPLQTAAAARSTGRQDLRDLAERIATLRAG